MSLPSLRSIAALLAALSLAGCSTLGYYGQAVTGHLRLVTARDSIEDVLASDDTPAAVRNKLATVREARHFASDALHLPENRSYLYYTQLDRPYAVWNVVATPYDSLAPLQWCFPVAGCVSYRGYFEESDANEYAEDLRKKGHDVAVLGATAYSTLGWFADPVLSTMLAYPEPELAGTIFHELAHQRLYVKGDTAFNEAFATVVEETGVRRWLTSRNADAQIQAWEQRGQTQRAFTELLLDTRTELAALFDQSGDLDRQALEAEKRATFDRLRERFRAMSEKRDMSRYEAWMNRELNNAHLALVSAYRGGLPAFERLLDACDGDLERFYEMAEEIADWKEEKRAAWLEAKSKPPRCK